MTFVARPSTAKTYWGTPCRHGHPGLRYATNGSCVECLKIARRARTEEAREAAADAGQPKRRYEMSVKVKIAYAPEVAKAGRGSAVKVNKADAKKVSTKVSDADVKKVSAYDPLEDL